MKLLVKNMDMRGGYQDAQAWKTDVLDEDTGKIVGSVHSQREPAMPAFGASRSSGENTKRSFRRTCQPRQMRRIRQGRRVVLNRYA